MLERSTCKYKRLLPNLVCIAMGHITGSGPWVFATANSKSAHDDAKFVFDVSHAIA